MLEPLKPELEAAFPGAKIEIILNPSPCAQHSLLIDAENALGIALYLRDNAALKFDYCSNVTGIDWPLKEVKEKIKVKKLVDGEEKEVDETVTRTTGGYLEVVYHLYSMDLRTGPLVLRLRTGDRDKNVHLPSLTPVWRSCDFQEREIFDLYGVIFDGHPDLRRILMWDGFADYPMRRDYVEPDDYEYEPTAHDEVLARTRAHYANAAGGEA